MTPKEVAETLHVSRRSVYRMADQLGGFYVGGSLRFDSERLGAWLSRQKARGRHGR